MRFLDYRKVKDVERQKAKELFGTAAEPSALASKVCLHFSHSYEKLYADLILDYGRQVQDFRRPFGEWCFS